MVEITSGPERVTTTRILADSHRMEETTVTTEAAAIIIRVDTKEAIGIVTTTTALRTGTRADMRTDTRADTKTAKIAAKIVAMKIDGKVTILLKF